MRYAAVSAISHDGLVRDHNEDSLVVGPWTLCATTTLTPQTFFFPVGDDPIVVAVADGLGGHPAGEEASALAVRLLARAAPTLTGDDAIRDVLMSCNDAMYEDALTSPAHRAMGTTVAGIVVSEAAVVVFNVGDSRVYAVDHGLRQLSADDNEPPWPAGRRSSVVTQVLGGSLSAAPIDPHISSRPVTEFGRYLICSDGLTDAIDEAAVAEILRGADGGKAVFELWQATIEAGAPDNVTVALVEFGTQPG